VRVPWRSEEAYGWLSDAVSVRGVPPGEVKIDSPRDGSVVIQS